MNAWTIIIYVAIALVVGLVTLQFSNFRSWLTWAVTKAEEKYGSDTGQLKLQYAYELATTKFKWLTKLIPYSAFKKLVDKALVVMKDMLNNNKKIAKIITSSNDITEKAKL